MYERGSRAAAERSAQDRAPRCGPGSRSRRPAHRCCLHLVRRSTAASSSSWHDHRGRSCDEAVRRLLRLLEKAVSFLILPTRGFESAVTCGALGTLTIGFVRSILVGLRRAWWRRRTGLVIEGSAHGAISG